MKPKIKATVDLTYFSERLNNDAEIGVINDKLHRSENLARHTIVLGQLAVAKKQKYDSETLVEIAKKNDIMFGIFEFDNFYLRDINMFVSRMLLYGFGYIKKKMVYEKGINLILNPILNGKYINSKGRERQKGFNKGSFATGQLAQSIKMKLTKPNITKKEITK